MLSEHLSTKPDLIPGSMFLTERLTHKTYNQKTFILVLEDRGARFYVWWVCPVMGLSGFMQLLKCKCFGAGKSAFREVFFVGEEWEE